MLSEKIGFSLILVASLAARLAVLPLLSGVSGGDFFNYLLITRQLAGLQTPFIGKRLPVYAAFLLPGHLAGCPLIWGRLLGIFCLLGILVVLYFWGKELEIASGVRLTALALVGFQPTLFIYSLRPLSHTLFALEVITCVYLLYKITHVLRKGEQILPRLLVGWGMLMGIMCMTRHEGFAVAALLGLSWVVVSLFCARTESHNFKFSIFNFRKINIKNFLREIFFVFVPLVVIVLPYFVSNYSRFGSFFYSPYVEDPGLNPAFGLPSFLVNLNKVKWVILRLWGDFEPFPIRTAFCFAFFVTLLPLLVPRVARLGKPLKMFLWGSFFSCWVLLFFLTPLQNFTAVFTFFFAVLMFTGLIKFTVEQRSSSILLLSLLFSQTLLLLLVQPWSRHLQHTFPFWALFLAYGVSWLVGNLPRKLGFCVRGLLLCIVGILLFSEIKGEIAQYIEGSLDSRPLLSAVQYLDSQEGTSAFPFKSSLVDYYLGGKAIFFRPDGEDPVKEEIQRAPQEQLAWLEKNKPRYVVYYNVWDAFTVTQARHYTQRFRKLREYEIEREKNSLGIVIYEFLLY